MKLLYLSYFADPKTFDNICKAGLSPSEARQSYDTALINNLLQYDRAELDLEIISYLPYNDTLGEVPTEGIYGEQKISYVWTTRSNITHMIKAMRKVKRLVKDWLRRTAGEERIILTYAANPILLQPIMSITKKEKIVTICSEIPKYRNMTEGNQLLNKIKKGIFTYYNEKMSGYIYMSRHMDEVCNSKNAPWIVVEGMTPIPPLTEMPQKAEECIFYAGGLHRENGIDILLDAVVQLNGEMNDTVKLQLCGKGNTQEKVEEYAKKYSFIEYLGVLPNHEIRELEKKATLLINPRKPDNLLTKYSFPSKTFEYFSSGTPAIITRLDGIPNEFYDHCYTCDAQSQESLLKGLKETLAIPLDEREKTGKGAYDFLCEEKSSQAQTKKIVDFLKILCR